MRAAVAIITWNGSRYVGPCLESVVGQDPCPDILVLDNASSDDTVDIARSFASRMGSSDRRLEVVVQSANHGYTRGANIALRALLAANAYDLVALLNQDVSLAPGWLAQMESLFALRADAGVVGGKILYPDGATLQHAGGYLTQPRLVGGHYGQWELDDGRYDVEKDVEFVTGAVVALRIACLERIGLFDEIFSPGYYEDVDLCARIRGAGWRVVYNPRAQARHVESASFSDRFERLLLTHRNRLIFAMDRLADRDFATRFCEAEGAAFASESLDLLRALALAYFQVSIRLAEIAEARLDSARRRRSVVEPIGSLLAQLRECCLKEIRQRRRAGFTQPS
jgi:GT2 family glycosyltransferase